MPPFDTAIRIGTVPRNWEKALGYMPDTPARWLMAYWIPGGDEAMFEDGRLCATGSPWPYLDLVGNPHYSIPIARAVATSGGNGMSALGNSDTEATHCLLCNLETREMYAAPIDAARLYVKPPLPEGYQPPTREEQRALGATVQAHFAAWREQLRAERAGKRLVVCNNCVNGYVRAQDGGYDICSGCGGAHARWEPVDAGDLPTTETWEVFDILDWPHDEEV